MSSNSDKSPKNTIPKLIITHEISGNYSNKITEGWQNSNKYARFCDINNLITNDETFQGIVGDQGGQ